MMKEHPKAKGVGLVQEAECLIGPAVLYVVNTGDAESMRLRLGVEEGRGQPCRGWLGDETPDEVHGPLEEEPGRFTGGIPDDSPAKGIGRPGAHARCLKGGGIHPGRVNVQRMEKDRRIVDLVEEVPIGGRVPSVGIPPLTHYPPVHRNDFPQPIQCLGCGLGSGQLDPAPPQGPHRKMGVTVHETRGHQPAREIILRGARRNRASQGSGGPDLPDSAVLPPEGVAPGTWIESEDAASPDEAAGGESRHGGKIVSGYGLLGLSTLSTWDYHTHPHGSPGRTTWLPEFQTTKLKNKVINM